MPFAQSYGPQGIGGGAAGRAAGGMPPAPGKLTIKKLFVAHPQTRRPVFLDVCSAALASVAPAAGAATSLGSASAAELAALTSAAGLTSPAASNSPPARSLPCHGGSLRGGGNWAGS